MKTCPYCGSNIEKINHHKYYCDFCAMNLDFQSVKENGERLTVRVSDVALDVHIDKTTPEIMTLSTYELLYLLRAIRKERSDVYSLMNVFYKAGKQENTNKFKEFENKNWKGLFVLYKKAFVVENIIRSRLGYVPNRITDTYLLNYLNNIKNDKSAPMVIRTERKNVHQDYSCLN